MSRDRHIRDAIGAVPFVRGRRIIAIAGAPASGKSTLAAQLQQQISGAQVLPMDGFHRSNAELDAQGLRSRKGAPETFDVAGFEAILQTVRAEPQVEYPTFDRSGDCVIPAGGTIRPEDHTILVEGNYLLLDVAPWDRLIGLWDFSIMLKVPQDELEKRLVARWLAHGSTREAALNRAQSNDIPNARYMIRHSVAPDMVVSDR